MSTELDIKVAEAMGWKHIDLGRFGLWDFTGIKLWKHLDGKARFYLPPYSTNMSAVWQVVRYARGKMLVLKLYQAVPSDEWVATFYEGYEGYASTAPEAICLAFLKAMERMRQEDRKGEL